MQPPVKRRIHIKNKSEKNIDVIIEPYSHERPLKSNENLYIDITMWKEKDVSEHISIFYCNDAIVLFEESDIDMEFYEEKEK
ncbi:hypothetical protein [Labrys sp. WJW]|uniref:hypothetical protein n=1 Tax=Labrys sp. WJW TaxID=1737983 RepID=UPI0012EA4DE3|nr:hypothetical protein [Labrys sp. WJW]